MSASRPAPSQAPEDEQERKRLRAQLVGSILPRLRQQRVAAAKAKAMSRQSLVVDLVSDEEQPSGAAASAPAASAPEELPIPTMAPIPSTASASSAHLTEEDFVCIKTEFLDELDSDDEHGIEGAATLQRQQQQQRQQEGAQEGRREEGRRDHTDPSGNTDQGV